MNFGNIKYTYRNFRKQKLFTFVNLAGLTLGIVSASLIFIYIGNELSYDRFNKNADRIFRVYGTYTRDGANETWVQTPAPLAPFLKNKFPEIAKTIRIASSPKCLISSGDKNYFENKIIIADSTLFDVFTFPLITGDPREVLFETE